MLAFKEGHRVRLVSRTGSPHRAIRLRDSIPAFSRYSMILSARSNTDAGIVSPSALAVLRPQLEARGLLDR